jgi:FkbM family methyltransferase
MLKAIQPLAWIGNRLGKPPGFERIVRWLAPPTKCGHLRELCLVRDGLVFLANPTIPVDWHITFFGTYEPEIRTIFRAVLQSGGICVDIGANVGWHTLLMASLVGANGRVLAVEANPAMLKRLQDNLGANRLSQVEVVPFAMTEAEGEVEFYAPDASDPVSGTGRVIGTPSEATAGQTIRVQGRRLDTIIAATQIERLDLIKIDVEGFELPVLRSGEEAIAKFRPHVVFEYNSEYAHRGGGTPAGTTEFFLRLRYRLFAIRRNWAEAIESDRWPVCSDIWAVPIS